MSKYKVNLARRDPAKVERLREIIDPFYDDSLEALRDLIAAEPPKEVIQAQDPRAGEKYIEAHRRQLSASASKSRAIGEHLNLIERLLDITGRDLKAEIDEETESQSEEKELLLKMLAQVKQNHPKTAQEIEAETGGEFVFVADRNRK